MTMSLRRLIAGLALAVLVALAPAAASARLIQLSFTGLVTGGQSDAIVSSADMEAWSEHTAHPDFAFQSFPGGHHYIREFPEGLHSGIAQALGVPMPVKYR